MYVIRSVVRGIDNLNERLGKLFSWTILTLMFFTCYEVFTRRVLGAPTIWSLEMSMFFACGVCMLALGYTQLHKEHVNVDLFYINFSPKTKAVCNIITYLLFLGLFSLILLVYGWFFFWDSWSIGERTPSAFYAIKYPSKLMVFFGAFLLFIQGMSDFIRDVVYLVKGERL